MSKVAHSQPGCGSASCACKAASSSSSTVKLPKHTSTTSHPKKSTIWGIDSPVTVTDETSSLVRPNGTQYGSTTNANGNGRHTGNNESIDFNSILRPTHTIADKCDRPGGTCCKDIVQEERKLIDPDVVRDIIIGLSDGLTVPFALTAGLSSLGSSKLVYMGGLAEIVGGAFSMGVGGYLAAKAEQDTFRHRYTEITNRLAVACDSELDREVHDILGPLGLQENVSRVVSRALAQAQHATEERDDRSFTSSHLAHQRSLFGRLGLTQRPVPKEGTVAFLLKLGEGMEEVPSSRLFLSAVTIGLSYAIGGILPIIPYFFIPVAYDALKWSILGTSIILVIFGALKSWFTGAALGPVGVAWGAISTLAVVAAAAAIAWGIVKALET